MLILKDHLCSTSILEKIYVIDAGTIELAEMIDHSDLEGSKNQTKLTGRTVNAKN